MEDIFDASTLDVAHCMEDIGPLMMSVELLDDLACPFTPFLTPPGLGMLH
jgi:hypothetical protein